MFGSQNRYCHTNHFCRSGRLRTWWCHLHRMNHSRSDTLCKSKNKILYKSNRYRTWSRSDRVSIWNYSRYSYFRFEKRIPSSKLGRYN
jgi:hypothetical protein